MPPSLVVLNARIKTNDPARPWAGGLAVQGERIAFVGSSAEMAKMAAESATVVDVSGKLLIAATVDGNDPSDVKIASATPANFMVVDQEPPANSTWANPGYRVYLRVVRGMILENSLPRPSTTTMPRPGTPRSSNNIPGS